MMQAAVARAERQQMTTLLPQVVQSARQPAGWREPERRTLRTWEQLVQAVVLRRSTRLLHLGQVLVGMRRAKNVKTTAIGVGDFLKRAHRELRPLSTRVIEALVQRLSAERWATSQGKVLVVLDPTDSPKRSRGSGKRGRGMAPLGKVRKAHRNRARQRQGQAGKRTRPRVETTRGSVDVVAGLVLKGKPFVPLARHRYSNAPPQLKSQNRVEEAVLAQAREVVRRLGLAAVVVADRGVGRKELLIKLARRDQDLVIRIDAALLARPEGAAAFTPWTRGWRSSRGWGNSTGIGARRGRSAAGRGPCAPRSSTAARDAKPISRRPR
ncbi:MAG: hypothetical protein HY690_00055 [Chloroflexi bacterium]|nr:hypothetical protein [Chloroflexota bacterium]